MRSGRSNRPDAKVLARHFGSVKSVVGAKN